MDNPTSNPTRANGRTFGAWLREMPRWKKVALLVATTAVVAGAVMMLVSPEAAPATQPTPGGQTDLQANLLPGAPKGGTGTAGTTPEAEPAAMGVFRLGFSFIAGFCLGSFVRATLKVASIAFGFWLAMTLVLSYYGLVVVDWTAIDQVWNRFCSNVENEWGNFQTFMTGSLPAAGLAVAGLGIGLKRH